MSRLPKFFCSCCALSAWLVFQAANAQNTLTLDNGIIRVRQDLAVGGAISYISKSDVDRNIVNVKDKGRYIQQSYYAGNHVNRQAEGQSPSWSPWTWNPIQVGDYAGNSARILASSSTSVATYVKCIPMLWDMNNRPAEAEMEQWTEIMGNVIKVKNRITCHRTDNIYGEGLIRDQELPAVYPISSLDRLYSYFGNAPFSNAPVVNTPVVKLSSGFWGQYRPNKLGVATESWMAFVDGNGWGIGVYTPSTTQFLAGMSGNSGGEAMSSSTCYIAPIGEVVFNKNTVFEYESFLIIGNLAEIRTTIYNLAGVNAGPAQNGAWSNVASGNWSEIGNWSGGLAANGSERTANFSTPGITGDVSVHLDSARTLGALVFGDVATGMAANWIVDNNNNVVNTLTLDGPRSISVHALDTGRNATISARLTGTDGLTKLGTGTLMLDAVNTYSGVTSVEEGTLEIGGVGQLGGGTYADAIVNNATFAYNSTAVQTLVGVISGSGALVKAGAGTLRLAGINTYTGPTTIGGGTLQIGLSGAANPITVENSGFEAPVLGTWQYGPISGGGWTFNDRSGIDRNSRTWYPTTAGHEGVQAGFMQGSSATIIQTITNNGPAGWYAISFQAEGRAGSYGPLGIILKVDEIAVETWPASTISQSQWLDLQSMVYLTAGTHTLVFQGNDTLGGDRSVAIDNVRIYQPTGGALPPAAAVNLTAAGAVLDLSGTTQTIGSLAGVDGSSVKNGNLVVGGDGTSTTFAGEFSGTSSLTKTGAGTLTFTGENTYMGDTTVDAGTLAIAIASLADEAAVNLSTGAVLDLAFTGTDTIASLTIDGIVQTLGTWGSPTSDATYKTTLISGNGILNVTTGSLLQPYSTWAATTGLTGLVGKENAPAADPDRDGLANLLEWILGGDPLGNSTNSLPHGDITATDFTFTFTRNDASESASTLIAQWSTSMDTWTDVPIDASSSLPDANGVSVNVSENGAGPDTVVVTVPRSQEASGSLFFRLMAVAP